MNIHSSRMLHVYLLSDGIWDCFVESICIWEDQPTRTWSADPLLGFHLWHWGEGIPRSGEAFHQLQSHHFHPMSRSTHLLIFGAPKISQNVPSSGAEHLATGSKAASWSGNCSRADFAPWFRLNMGVHDHFPKNCQLATFGVKNSKLHAEFKWTKVVIWFAIDMCLP